MNSYEGMINIASVAAKRAGYILMERLGDVHQVIDKETSYKDYVTDVDLQVEAEIIAIIKEAYPDHHILSEEQGDLGNESDYKWIIDPLDGTHNYAHNLPIFGVSIALEHKKQVVFGVMSVPYMDEIYTAEKGKGAYLNGEKIRVSDIGLNDALMIYDTKLRASDKPMIESLSRLVNEVFIIRMFGCAMWDLGLIARGKAELSVNFTYKPWDIAAAALIIEESKGKVTDLQGNPWTPYSNGYISSNGKVHDEVLNILNKKV
jgi:myo-inositol-1(or 4)-monophosphatase